MSDRQTITKFGVVDVTDPSNPQEVFRAGPDQDSLARAYQDYAIHLAELQTTGRKLVFSDFSEVVSNGD